MESFLNKNLTEIENIKIALHSLKNYDKKNITKKELSLMFGCNEEDISFPDDDIFNSNILYHFGDISFPNKNLDGFIFPKTVIGNVNLSLLEEGINCILPENIIGSLYMNELEFAKGITFPKNVTDTLALTNLKTPKYFILPNVGKSLDLNSLGNFDNFVFAKQYEELYINSLKSAKNVVWPDYVEIFVCDVFLDDLKCAKEYTKKQKQK